LDVVVISSWDSKLSSRVRHGHVLFDYRPSRSQIGFIICRNRNLGFFHMFGDARMTIWGVLAIVCNFLLAVLSGSQRWFYVASLLMLILFVITYARLSKPINQAQTEAAKNGKRLDNGRELQASWDRSLTIRVPLLVVLPAGPVPRIVGRFGVSVAGALPLERVRRLGLEKVGFAMLICHLTVKRPALIRAPESLSAGVTPTTLGLIVTAFITSDVIAALIQARSYWLLKGARRLI
jgi:hypothetical protein